MAARVPGGRLIRGGKVCAEWQRVKWYANGCSGRAHPPPRPAFAAQRPQHAWPKQAVQAQAEGSPANVVMADGCIVVCAGLMKAAWHRLGLGMQRRPHSLAALAQLAETLTRHTITLLCSHASRWCSHRSQANQRGLRQMCAAAAMARHRRPRRRSMAAGCRSRHARSPALRPRG